MVNFNEEPKMSQPTKKQFIQAVKYIYAQCDNPSLRLEDIAQEIGISVSSLKRLFEQYLAQSPGAFIRTLRMELAFRTLQCKNDSILEIALSAGFEDHSAFSRRFKDIFGYSPVQARKKLNIVSELESVTLEEPEIIEIQDLEIQCVTEKGLYFECAPKAWDKLQQKLTPEELDESFSGLYIGIGHDNGHEMPEDQVRFSAGISLVPKDLHIERMTLSGGQYARFRFEGKVWNIGLAYHYIYGKWVENSAFTISKNHPAFMVFTNWPDATQAAKIMIYVPVGVLK